MDDSRIDSLARTLATRAPTRRRVLGLLAGLAAAGGAALVPDAVRAAGDDRPRVSRYGEFCGRDRNGDYWRCDVGLFCDIFNSRDDTGVCKYEDTRGGGPGDYCDDRDRCAPGLYCRQDPSPGPRSGRCVYS